MISLSNPILFLSSNSSSRSHRNRPVRQCASQKSKKKQSLCSRKETFNPWNMAGSSSRGSSAVYRCGHSCAQKDAGKVLNALSYLAACLSILFCCFSPTKLLALQDTGLAPTDPPTQLYWAIGLFWGTTLCSLCSPTTLLREGQEESSENGEEEPTPKVTVEIIVRLLHYVRMSGFGMFWIHLAVHILHHQNICALLHWSALLDSVKLMIVISVISSVAGGFRGGSFDSLVRQDVAFYDTHKTGEVTSRLSADTQTMSDTVSLNINIFLRNTVQMAGSMIFMMALCWKLSLIPFVVVPIILMASKIFGVYYDLLSNKPKKHTMRTVRSFACEEVEADRFYNKLSDTLAVTKRRLAYVGYLWVSELFQTLINIAVLWYGGHLVLTTSLTKTCWSPSCSTKCSSLTTSGSWAKCGQYIDRQPDIETDGDHAPDHINGHIEFQNVHFAYPSRPDNPILKGLSFSVQPGQVIALHFYRPTSGRILVDGVNIKDYEHHYIHNKIAWWDRNQCSLLDLWPRILPMEWKFAQPLM
uniref:ABC transmembrane type-1 domain-containing protein n=1 Tax=Ditylenchus dipsaci TaxID=166011 RepID=A0A915CN03_9BILA